jgi:stearoyl-CoA desaturase (delta-9 desaturase)
VVHKLAPPRNSRQTKSSARRKVERRIAHNSASRRTELPPAPWSHKLTMLTAVVLPLVGVVIGGALAWRYGFMGWLNLGMLLAGWAITGTGITIGFHRLLTHRSFDTYRWVKLFWMTCGALSVEGSPLVWCAVHRRHHELSDLPGDPHSPHLHGMGLVDSLRGLWYAHTGWLFTGYWSSPDMQRYVPDLLADKALVAVDRLYYLWVLVSLALPAAIGGLFATGALSWSWRGAFLGLVWGGLVRIFVTHHVTWSINSICHVFGRKDYDAHDESRNNWLCGLLGFGEGWHNNHHAFPTSARHGLAWWQFDTSWLIIRGMELVGLAWNVRLPTEKQLVDKRLAV